MLARTTSTALPARALTTGLVRTTGTPRNVVSRICAVREASSSTATRVSILGRLLPARLTNASRWRFASLLSVGTAAGAALGLSVVYMEANDSTHLDKTTGLSFDRQISVETSKGKVAQSLVGTGCRYKYSVVQVYAVGLYVGADALSATGSDDEVLRGVLESDSTATLFLKLNRELDVGVMVEALEDAIRSRINKHAADKQKANEAVDAFRNLLFGAAGIKTIPKNGTFHFVRDGDKLWVHVQGKQLGCVVSKDVVHALFDTYLGANPISPEAKAAFAKGLRGGK